ncbi:hypothetical protein ACFE04_018572 [Oxalis oulophora]
MTLRSVVKSKPTDLLCLGVEVGGDLVVTGTYSDEGGGYDGRGGGGGGRGVCGGVYQGGGGGGGGRVAAKTVIDFPIRLGTKSKPTDLLCLGVEVGGDLVVTGTYSDEGGGYDGRGGGGGGRGVCGGVYQGGGGGGGGRVAAKTVIDFPIRLGT